MHAKIPARDLVAELDDVVVVLRERIVDEAEMPPAVLVGVKLQIVHDPVNAAISQLLTGHLKRPAEGAVVRAAADESNRPVLGAGGSVRPAV